MALWIVLVSGAFFFSILASGIAVAAGGAIYAYGRYNEVAVSVVPPQELIADLPTGGARIYDRNGELLYEFVDAFTGLRRPVPIDEISPWLILATVSVEDATFFTNNGLNVRGLIRAAVENLTPYGGDFLEGSGGSSITQQLAKNVYIPLEERAERSIERKLRETVIAIELTEQYTKNEILGWYLNSISYGGIYTGVEAAALGYFDKTSAELTLAEASLLAGIPQSPALYFPFDHIDPNTGQLAIGSAPRVRQRQVLDLMVQTGAITAREADDAMAERIRFKENRFEISAPHFVLGRVADEIRARFGDAALVSRGIEVTTTLDMNLQREAERILEEQLLKVEEASQARNASLVAMDVVNGQLLAYVGSRDYFDEEIEGRNDNATAPNSPGSTLKPFTFMTAFMQGWGTGTGIIDAPYSIIDAATGDEYAPRDPISELQGPMTAASALGNSLNITAIKAIEFAGVNNTLSVLRQVGHTALDNPGGYGPALTLGGGEITLFDQVVSYGTLAAEGVMRGQDIWASEVDPGERTLEPVALLLVVDSSGDVLYSAQRPEERRVVPSEFANLVTGILSDGENQCITYGRCNALSLPDGRPSAAKTGTSEPFEDSREIGETWTIGYTPHLVAGVWVGNADNTPLVNISSAGASLTAWKTFTIFAADYLEHPRTEFEEDPGVVEREVCWPSGRLPTDLCPQINRYESLYAESVLPQSEEDLIDFEDTWWQLVGIDIRTGLLADEETPAQFIKEDVRLRLPPEEIEKWEGLEEWADEQGVLSLLAPREQPAGIPPPVSIAAPRADEVISGRTVIRGHADSPDFLGFKVQWGRGASPESWVTIRNSEEPITADAGALVPWDTTALPNGAYTIRVLLEDEELGTFYYQHQVKIDNGTEAVPVDLAPLVQIDQPQQGATLDGNVDIRGTAGSLAFETMVVEIGAGLEPDAWTEIARHDKFVFRGRLALWDSTGVDDGTYTIRVTVLDTNFGPTQAVIFVSVRNDEE